MANAILEELKTKTNVELQEYCDKNGIEVKKKNAKPNKTELLSAIEAWMSKENEDIETQTIEETMDDVEIQEQEEYDDFDNFDPTIPVVEKKKGLSNEEKKKGLSNEEKLDIIKKAKALKRVVVNINQAYGESVKEGQVMRISIGNAVINAEDEIFPIGVPWHLTTAAVEQLQRIEKKIPIIDKNSGMITGYKPVKKFFIQELPPLTKAELEALAKKQTIRNAGTR
jgi:hypothetical protein